MTIREKITQLLDDRGIWPDQAAPIIERFLASDAGAAMRGRMDDQLGDYPASVVEVTWIGVKREALAWVDETCPEAWYRPLLEGD